MFQISRLLFFLITLNLLSCSTNGKYRYAIKDFRKSLQPYLTGIVAKGIVAYKDSALRYMATDRELMLLGQSEHPVLRASAYREMLFRKSFDHFDLLMNHLDDTAVVATDAGEWGIWFRTVSDDILEEAKWKDSSDKSKTIDKVITEHNYLRAAYTILSKIQPQEKYYPYIKDMATRDRKSIGYNDEPMTADIELGLYGLAKFKKREDVKVIKDLLMSNRWRMSSVSFALMEDFPDTSYLEVFETYYKSNFYHNICMNHSVEDAIHFVDAVATYKNERSANILEAILNRKPFVNCDADTVSLKGHLIDAIWNNPCDSYLQLRKQIKRYIRNDEKDWGIPVEPVYLSDDTATEKIRW